MDVLLVEDNQSDVVLFRRCFEKLESEHRLYVLKDGAQARAFLWREGMYAQAPRPALVLLDLSLPKLHGKTLIDEMKHDPALRMISVIVLSSSASSSDQTHYGVRANAYVVKPTDLRQFEMLVKFIDVFWLNLITRT